MPSLKVHYPDSNDLHRIMFDRVALGMFIIIGSLMALAYSSLLPEVALLAGYPALLATLVLDTFLFNTFRIDTGSSVWGLIVGFVYFEAVVIGIVVDWFQSRN